jgi:hypothetical protein
MAKEIQQVNLDIDELKLFITHIINNNRYLQKDGKPPVSVEVVGDSGIGKTSAVLQMANALELNFVKLNLAQIEELGDLVGFPVRQFQLCKKGSPAKTVKKQVREGDKLVMKDVPVEGSSGEETECLWIDEQAVQEYLKQGYAFTGQKRMSYCPPEWIADKQGGGILLLDDWNRADIRFIQAVMELIDRQEYISWKLPKDWHILLTSNPDNGEYLVNSIDSAQRTRFITANLKFNVDVWARWAEASRIDGRCINFMLMHPELVQKETNARSITTFFNSISSFEKFEDNLPMIQMIGEGSVGPEFSTLFTTFINNRLDKIISPKEILFNDSWSYIKGALGTCIGIKDDYRADIASILATRLVNYSVVHSQKDTVNQKMIDRIISLTTEDIFANDLKYYMVKGILNGNKLKFQGLMLDEKVVKIAVK